MNLVSQQIAQISNPQFLSPLQTASEFFQFIISHLLQIALVIGVLGFITYLIIGGINYITSSGNRASLEDARRKISQALVGLIVLFSVFFIIQFANIAFGLNIGNLGFGYWPGWTPPGYSSPTPVPPGDPCAAPSCSGPNSDICLNSATNCSCDQVCLAKGFIGCQSVGTNPPSYDNPVGYDNFQMRIRSGGGSCIDSGATCAYPMSNQGNFCAPATTQWTYCNCMTAEEEPPCENVIDQPNNNGGNTGELVGQSFTTSTDFELTYVNICATSDAWGNYPDFNSLEIRSGENIDGTLLASTTSYFDTGTLCDNNGHWFLFSFSSPSSLTSGNIYTIRIDKELGPVLTDTNNPYSDGRAYLGDNFYDATDLSFQVSTCDPEFIVMCTNIPSIPNCESCMLCKDTLTPDVVWCMDMFGVEDQNSCVDNNQLCLDNGGTPTVDCSGIVPPSPTPTINVVNPDITNLAVSDNNPIRGDPVTITATTVQVTYPINRVEFWYAPVGTNDDYCSGTDYWTRIGIDYDGDGDEYSVSWDTSTLLLGSYVVVANVIDDYDNWCTGNPGGCGSIECSSGNNTVNLYITETALGFNCIEGCGFYYMSCVNIGTDHPPTNSNYWTYTPLSCTQVPGDCSTRMVEIGGVLCDGRTPEWTYCNCIEPSFGYGRRIPLDSTGNINWWACDTTPGDGNNDFLNCPWSGPITLNSITPNGFPGVGEVQAQDGVFLPNGSGPEDDSYLQSVWSSDQGYLRYVPLDINGNPDWNCNIRDCDWIGPIDVTALPGNGSIQVLDSLTLTNIQSASLVAYDGVNYTFCFNGYSGPECKHTSENGAYLQTFWRNNYGYLRYVPLLSNGNPDFNCVNDPDNTVHPCPWSQGITPSGLPGSGNLQSLDGTILPPNPPDYPLGSYIQGLWRGDGGYVRALPLNTFGVPDWSCNTGPCAWPTPVLIDSLHLPEPDYRGHASHLQSQDDILLPNLRDGGFYQYGSYLQGLWAGIGIQP